MLPRYPDFKKLTLADKNELEKYIKRYSSHSDFDFLSLWSYNTDDDIEISILNDNLVVKFRDYITNEPFYSFLGNNEMVDTIEKLLEKCKKEGLKQELKFIHEENIKDAKDLSEKYNILEDRDNFDYFLSVEEVSALAGDKYHTHKNFVNRFQRENQACIIKPIILTNKKVKSQIEDLFASWQKSKNKSYEETEHELLAIKRVLKDSKHFDLISLGVYDGNKLIGFIIAETTDKEVSQSHFAKADTSYSGIYYILFHHLSKSLQKKGVKLINNEQDLGIAGLRKSKQQWNPVKYLKKYTITPL